MREAIKDVDGQCATPAQIAFTNVATGCTMIMNRSCVEESLKGEGLADVAMHDWWVALVACMLGERVYINKSLVFYRQHDNNVVGAARKQASAQEKSKNYATIWATGGSRAVRRKLAQIELAHIRQAQEFRRMYGARVEASLVKELNSVCDLPKSSLLHRFTILRESHLRRKGPKAKLRQLLAMACLRVR